MNQEECKKYQVGNTLNVPEVSPPTSLLYSLERIQNLTGVLNAHLNKIEYALNCIQREEVPEQEIKGTEREPDDYDYISTLSLAIDYLERQVLFAETLSFKLSKII